MTNATETLARPMDRRGTVLPQLLATLYARWLGWRRCRRDQLALQRQPDYLLRDIGVERHEIERALRGRPYC